MLKMFKFLKKSPWRIPFDSTGFVTQLVVDFEEELIILLPRNTSSWREFSGHRYCSRQIFFPQASNLPFIFLKKKLRGVFKIIYDIKRGIKRIQTTQSPLITRFQAIFYNPTKPKYLKGERLNNGSI